MGWWLLLLAWAAGAAILEDINQKELLNDWEELIDSEQRLGRASPSREEHEVALILAVKHPSEEAVEESLKRVSSPSSSTYGRYWSLDESFAAFLGTRARAETLQAQFHAVGAAVEVSQMGDFMRVTMRVPVLETLFNLRLRPFQHQAHPGRIRFGLRPKERVVVPDMLAKHVDFISGLHLRSRFTLRGRAGSTGSAPAPRTGEGNVTEVQVVEARDRGFQLHVRVLVEHERYKQLCAGQSGVSCAIRHFKSLCTPVRAGGTEYLKPVEIQGQIQEDACSLDSAGPRLQISCVVVLGPSLDLVNFSPTQLQLQTAPGAKPGWEEDSHGLPVAFPWPVMLDVSR
ncbi:unnamed protein product [Durusdinium trenchii]|uniref:Tripeptidyl-peptidase 1 (TPP-1) (Tripeptidyl aminopeptidase) (Tripeptidyl-peptidase I) (TPP-I) n=2 Tax=Durusdinium trenchii TaxID=1381693 RepID=A0ABP0IA11_9DINO